jgi:hypothetical protein
LADTSVETTCQPATEHLSSILVSHVTVPAEVDRMQLTMHQTPTQVTLYESERWAAPLREQIRSILVADLRQSIPGTPISDDPRLPGSAAPVRLAVAIEELSAQASQAATVRARWEVTTSAQHPAQTGELTVREPLTTAALDSVVEAWSHGLAQVSHAIARSLACPKTPEALIDQLVTP